MLYHFPDENMRSLEFVWELDWELKFIILFFLKRVRFPWVLLSQNMRLFFPLLFLFFLLVSSQSTPNNTWNWISGSNTTNSPGIYGAKGISSPSNYPGARQHAVGGIDSFGSFWLFGGFGYVSIGTYGK